MKTLTLGLKPLFGLLLALTAATEALADPAPVIALSGFDPVALTQGAAVPSVGMFQMDAFICSHPKAAGTPSSPIPRRLRIEPTHRQRAPI